MPLRFRRSQRPQLSMRLSEKLPPNLTWSFTSFNPLNRIIRSQRAYLSSTRRFKYLDVKTAGGNFRRSFAPKKTRLIRLPDGCVIRKNPVANEITPVRTPAERVLVHGANALALKRRKTRIKGPVACPGPKRKENDSSRLQNAQWRSGSTSFFSLSLSLSLSFWVFASR